jgi:hypothetical protein
MNNMQGKITFQPFIGENFHSQKKKVLLLGDSHYCNNGCKGSSIENCHDCCPNFTKDVVKEFLERGYQQGKGKALPNFTNVYYGNNEVAEGERKNLWNTFAFYNFVQRSMPGEASENPIKEDYENSAVAYFEVLEELKPDLIVVFGKTLWDRLPEADGWEDGNEVLDFGKIKYCNYNGKKYAHFCTHHPSIAFGYKNTPLLQELCKK